MPTSQSATSQTPNAAFHIDLLLLKQQEMRMRDLIFDLFVCSGASNADIKSPWPVPQAQKQLGQLRAPCWGGTDDFPSGITGCTRLWGKDCLFI